MSSGTSTGPVAVITGRTRAGKTTLATALEAQLGWPRAPFSDYIRAEAQQRQIPHTRRDLQDLGATLIEELGWDGFVAALLAHAQVEPHGPAIVEGARHLGTLDAIERAFTPDAMRVIYLRVSDAERNRRLAAEGVDPDTGAAWEQHSTEVEVVSDFPERADLILDADQPEAQVIESALAWLRGA